MALKALHDKLAFKAAMSGKKAAQFNKAAQKHANATWIYLIIAGLVWYFAGLIWALIPGLLGIFSALKSFSSTMIATRIQKMERNNIPYMWQFTGDRLTALREARGLSQEAFATQLRTSSQHVSQWERGELTPSTMTILKIANMFDVSPMYFLTKSETMSGPPELRHISPEEYMDALALRTTAKHAALKQAERQAELAKKVIPFPKPPTSKNSDT